jgi:formate-dependent phosphoribosylglycinamide formyltransferase (GAR transformylase)
MELYLQHCFLSQSRKRNVVSAIGGVGLYDVELDIIAF